MQTYTDEYLEHYAARYVAMYLKGHGITLQQYLVAPERYEYLALEPLPLLPAQQAAVLRFWQRWDTGLAAISEPVSDNDDIEIQAAAWDWRDMLDRWRAEEAEAERALNRMNQRNGAYIEPMRHHRHNRGMNRHTANFERKQARKGA